MLYHFMLTAEVPRKKSLELRPLYSCIRHGAPGSRWTSVTQEVDNGTPQTPSPSSRGGPLVQNWKNLSLDGVL
ncbi:jg19077 [Pararge aegeria aegeria]|uniref:Jg19077 protein n=1 Tax=Pararge aegeria aegeria TaxID=348720 RepID=A0A8S4SNQ3_9NEOP|nr:jg19077 [Pararge aegeria aegeria]